MAFNTINIGAKVFNSIGNGLYQLSTVGFGQASNTVKISRGTRDKIGNTSCSISRHREIDVIGSDPLVTTRRKCSVVVSIVAPEGMTVADIDSMLDDVNVFLTPETLTRILMGEN